MDFMKEVLVVLAGTAAAVIAGFILKAFWDLFIKLLAKANKKFGLWVIQRRKDRFNARAADLKQSIDDCTKAVNRIDERLKKYFREELDAQYQQAVETKAHEDIKKFLDSKQEFINFGGTEDELLRYETQMLCALCAAPPKEPEIRLKSAAKALEKKETETKKKTLVGKQ